MRRKTVTIARAVVAGAASLALVAACTPDRAGGSSDGEGAPSGSLEFVWPGTSDPEMAVARDFAAAMAEEGIDIEYNFLSWGDMQQQLAVRIQADDPPDLSMTQDVTDFVRMGALLPLDERFADSDWTEDDFRPGTLEYSTLDGSLYSIPYSAQAWTLVVNEDLLADAGYSVEDLVTWDDMEEIAEAVTGDGVYGFAYPLQNPRFAFRVPATAGYSNDLNLGSTDPADEPQWIELLEHVERMAPYRPAADQAWAYPEMFRAYASGEVAMIAAGTFFTANVYELNPEVIERSVQIPYPHGPSASEAQAPISNAGFAIFEGSENADLAWRVIEELMQPEWQARLTTVANSPALVEVTAEDLREYTEQYYPDAVEGHMRQAELQIDLIESAGVPLEKIPGQPAMEPEFQAVIVDFLDGRLSAQDAYARIVERFDAVASNQ